jgi:nitrogenase-associated protein
MTHIIFYEKPGCGGNAKQRALLEAAGHTLDRRSLLDAPWTSQSLLGFLQALPVHQWFNRAAPRVKSGEVVPEAVDADTALALLLEEPLLIRRPLMQRPDGARLVGFDTAEVERFVGLSVAESTQSLPASMEGCAAAGQAQRSTGCKVPASS